MIDSRYIHDEQMKFVRTFFTIFSLKTYVLFPAFVFSNGQKGRGNEKEV